MSSIKENIVLEPFACFKELSTYIKDNQKYLCFYLHRFTPNYGLAEDFKYFTLMVPDNNSEVVEQLKKLGRRSKGKFFSVPFRSLKFEPNFRHGTLFGENGLLVKDTEQLRKITETRISFPQIAFKVVKQFKTGVNDLTYEESVKDGSYTHVLEIEPLNLGIEGFPLITQIIFSFFAREPGQSAKNLLVDSKLHQSKSQLLSDSAGKKFMVGVRGWHHWTNKPGIVEKGSHGLAFLFTDDFDQITEIKDDDHNNNKPNFYELKKELYQAISSQDKEKLRSAIKKAKELETTLSQGLKDSLKRVKDLLKELENNDNKNTTENPKILRNILIGGVIILALGFILCYYFYKKKRGK